LFTECLKTQASTAPCRSSFPGLQSYRQVVIILIVYNSTLQHLGRENYFSATRANEYSSSGLAARMCLKDPMHRTQLLAALEAFQPYDNDEAEMVERTKLFVREHEDCFERTLAIGHITGSAFIVNNERTHILLTHHKKLNRWLQLGGHADGDGDIRRVALREATEESGLTDVRTVRDGIFDVDVHLIPARKNVAEHYHYDIRYLCYADSRIPLIISDESHDLVWVPIQSILNYTEEQSILRMVYKV
jgi:8-oxo-dGTP pyrophosphatase MutT (NUDIX family)